MYVAVGTKSIGMMYEDLTLQTVQLSKEVAGIERQMNARVENLSRNKRIENRFSLRGVNWIGLLRRGHR